MFRKKKQRTLTLPGYLVHTPWVWVVHFMFFFLFAFYSDYFMSFVGSVYVHVVGLPGLNLLVTFQILVPSSSLYIKVPAALIYIQLSYSQQLHLSCFQTNISTCVFKKVVAAIAVNTLYYKCEESTKIHSIFQQIIRSDVWGEGVPGLKTLLLLIFLQ